jgi:hypothetical protein
MNPKSKRDSTAGGASRGSPLAPCSFYLANTFELVQQQKPKQNHLHEYLYKTQLSPIITNYHQLFMVSHLLAAPLFKLFQTVPNLPEP